jgi:high affinity Mn2+ porin
MLARLSLIAALLSCAPMMAHAEELAVQPPAVSSHTAVTGEDRYNIHFQATTIDQGHFPFHAAYTGPNSLQPYAESDVSVTTTFFFGLRLWHGGSFYLNPELSGGQGMSGALGVSGFPNGETYRIGNPQPVIKTARLYAQQVFGLGQDTERVDDGPNQLAGTIPKDRITVIAGKFGMMDWFDNNAYSHDPRSQFMNWNLANSGAWDYPADTFGYTWGVVTEYHVPSWAVRAAAVAEPEYANQIKLDTRIGRANGFAVEGEHQSPWDAHKGTFRFLVYLNQAHMGNYDDAIALGQQSGTTPNIIPTRAYGHTKYGFTSSDDIQLTDTLGAFTRLSWSDGRNETWAYTEADGSVALGLDWTAAAFGRPKDHWGAAELMDVLSSPHRTYLGDGGSGFLLGDGALHYGPEMVTETYYSIQCRDWLKVSPDAQYVVNPGYNRARGPVPVWGVRVHAEF